jgi:hypothetical protein
VLGYAAGFALWLSVFPALRPVLGRLLGGSVSVAAFGATVGLCVGVAQVLLVRWLAPARLWIPATILGLATGFVLAAWSGLLLSEAFGGSGVGVYLSDAVEDLTFGLLLGLCVGVARAFALRQSQGTALARRWIIASAVGLMVGYAASLGILELLPALPSTLIGAVFGACVGGIAALLEWLIVGRLVARTGAAAI